MPVLSVTDITKSYGVTPILDKVSFHVEAGEKIGVIGVNGAGKTTLMNILSGKEKADSGSVFISGDTTMGFLEQQDHFDDDSTLLEETKRIYRRFTRMESELSELSQRIALASGAAEHDSADDTLLRRYGDLQDRYQREGGYTYRSEMRGILSSMGLMNRSMRSGSAHCPEASEQGSRWPASSWRSRTSCFWTSLRTTSTSAC